MNGAKPTLLCSADTRCFAGVAAHIKRTPCSEAGYLSCEALSSVLLCSAARFVFHEEANALTVQSCCRPDTCGLMEVVTYVCSSAANNMRFKFPVLLFFGRRSLHTDFCHRIYSLLRRQVSLLRSTRLQIGLCAVSLLSWCLLGVCSLLISAANSAVHICIGNNWERSPCIRWLCGFCFFFPLVNV